MLPLKSKDMNEAKNEFLASITELLNEHQACNTWTQKPQTKAQLISFDLIQNSGIRV